MCFCVTFENSDNFDDSQKPSYGFCSSSKTEPAGLDNLDGGFDFVVQNDGIESEKQVLASVIEWIQGM